MASWGMSPEPIPLLRPRRRQQHVAVLLNFLGCCNLLKLSVVGGAGDPLQKQVGPLALALPASLQPGRQLPLHCAGPASPRKLSIPLASVAAAPCHQLEQSAAPEVSVQIATSADHAMPQALPPPHDAGSLSPPARLAPQPVPTASGALHSPAAHTQIAALFGLDTGTQPHLLHAPHPLHQVQAGRAAEARTKSPWSYYASRQATPTDADCEAEKAIAPKSAGAKHHMSSSLHARHPERQLRVCSMELPHHLPSRRALPVKPWATMGGPASRLSIYSFRQADPAAIEPHPSSLISESA
mmetsp:Transcript_10809/g.24459  ORF Transcript_10809/g.24459 Transcript_10809/m.24459 type:complete len:298 (+) Transcript_10809:647-1540(+)